MRCSNVVSVGCLIQLHWLRKGTAATCPSGLGSQPVHSTSIDSSKISLSRVYNIQVGDLNVFPIMTDLWAEILVLKFANLILLSLRDDPRFFKLCVHVFRRWTVRLYLINLTWGYNADALLKAWTLSVPWKISLHNQIQENEGKKERKKKKICKF